MGSRVLVFARAFVGCCVLSISTAGLAAAGCGSQTVIDISEGGGPTTTSSSGSGGSAGMGGMGGTAGAGGVGGPIDCADDYTNITGPCDLLNQDCPPGQWCNVVPDIPSSTTQCVVGSGGAKGQGDSCDHTAQCQTGLTCEAGWCSPFCCPDNDLPCQDGICSIAINYDSGGYAFLCFYDSDCLFQAKCEPGFGCYVVDVDAGYAQCSPESGAGAGEGESCTYLNDCGDSQMCNTDAPDNGLCRDLCDVGSWQNLTPGLGGCAPGRSCNDLSWPGFPGVGMCLPS